MKTNIHFFKSSRSVLRRMRNVSDKSCRENHNTFYVKQRSSENRAFYEIMWKNIMEPGRPQMTIWRICSARRIPKVKIIHSEYVNVIAFPLQQSLHERASMLRYTYKSYLIIHSLRSCTILYFRNVPSHGLGLKASVQILDGILFKSSFIAEYNRPWENVSVTFVSTFSSSVFFLHPCRYVI